MQSGLRELKCCQSLSSSSFRSSWQPMGEVSGSRHEKPMLDTGVSFSTGYFYLRPRHWHKAGILKGGRTERFSRKPASILSEARLGTCSPMDID